MNPALDLAAVALVVVVTALVGGYGLRVSRTTSDFFVASRTVRPVWNASAISGEYLSAGTFLGLSGLVLLGGARGFWFPIGYAAGYLLVLMFIAAPLRRSGALYSFHFRMYRKSPMPDAARVLIGPEEMALTRMPFRPRSAAR